MVVGSSAWSPARKKAPPDRVAVGHRKPFDNIEHARDWVRGFVAWYNDEHLHSGIRYVRPSERHDGLDRAILAKRDRLYRNAQRMNPRRWSGATRNWKPVGRVYLNPARQEVRVATRATATT